MSTLVGALTLMYYISFRLVATAPSAACPAADARSTDGKVAGPTKYDLFVTAAVSQSPVVLFTTGGVTPVLDLCRLNHVQLHHVNLDRVAGKDAIIQELQRRCALTSQWHEVLFRNGEFVIDTSASKVLSMAESRALAGRLAMDPDTFLVPNMPGADIVLSLKPSLLQRRDATSRSQNLPETVQAFLAWELKRVQDKVGFDGWHLANLPETAIETLLPHLTSSYLLWSADAADEVSHDLDALTALLPVVDGVMLPPLTDRTALTKLAKVAGGHRWKLHFGLDPLQSDEISARMLRFADASICVPIQAVTEAAFWATNWRALSPVENLHGGGSEALYTAFNVGRGESTAIDGRVVSSAPWQNDAHTDVLPTLNKTKSPIHMQISMDMSFQGGSSLQLSATLPAKARASVELLPLQVHFAPRKVIRVAYTFHTAADPAAFGIALNLTSKEELVLRGGPAAAQPSLPHHSSLSPLLGRAKHTRAYGPVSETLQNGWRTRVYHLGGALWDGHVIQALSVFGVNLNNDAEVWAVHLGQVVVCPLGAMPSPAVTAVEVDHKTATLQWNVPSTVQYTHVFEHVFDGQDCGVVWRGRATQPRWPLPPRSECMTFYLQPVAWTGDLGPRQRVTVYVLEHSCAWPFAMAPTTTGAGTDDQVKKKTKSISHKLSRALGLKSRKTKSNNSTPQANSAMPTNELEIERLFSEAVENMALPKAATDRMRTLPLSQKWQIIQDWMAKQNSKSHHSERTQPVYWVHKLQDAVCEDVTTLTNDDARQLHVLMRGCDKDWLTEFHKEDGVVALTEWMAAVASENHTTLLLDAMRCLKCLMNNHHGMQLLLQEPEAIEVLVLCLDFDTPDRRDITLMTLEMLSLMCWFSETGHSAVLHAMERYRRANHERSRYWSVVECIKDGESLELQAACLTFINTLVSTCSALDDRVDVRNDFLAMDLLVVCHAIEAQYDALEPTPTTTTYGAWGQGDAEKAAAKSFFKQVEVFEGLMHSDMQDTIAHGLDLANVDAVVDRLKQRAKAHGWSDRLLHALLALLVIPGEISIGEKMWDMAEEALIQITSCHTYKDLSTKRVTFAAVKSALKQIEDLEHAKAHNERLKAEVAQLRGKLIVLQAQPISAEQEATLAKIDDSHTLTQELQAALAKVSALESQVAKLQQDGVDSSAPGTDLKRISSLAPVEPPATKAPVAAPMDPRLEKYARLVKMGMPKEQVAMKMKAEGMDIRDLDDVKTAGGGPPSTEEKSMVLSESDADPAYEKFARLLKMGMPVEQVQLKAKAEGLDPSKLAQPSQAQHPPTSSSSSTGPTPDAKYDKFVKLLKMGMPKDQVKLKAQAEGLDPSVLDTILAASSCGSTGSAADAPPPVLQFTESHSSNHQTPRVRQPSHYALTHARLYWTVLPDAAVEGSIWEKMDESKLGLDLSGTLDKEFGQDSNSRTDSMSTLPPQAAAIKPKVVHLVDPKRQQNCSIALSRFRMTSLALKQAILTLDDSGYEGDPAILGDTEKFFVAVLDIPRLAQRLRAVHTTWIHRSREDDVRAKAMVLEKAVSELTSSHHTVAVLEIILAVGNYLNGGTSRGGVWGFKLDILPKLAQVKATTSSAKSLLHVIADLVVAKAPHASAFYDSLPSMEAAAAISLTQLQTDLRGIEAAVAVVQQELTLQRDPFRSKMQPFVTTAQADCAAIKQLLSRLDGQFQRAIRSFGVDKPSDGVIDMAQWFFGLWSDFCKAYKQAVAENDQRRKDALKAAMKPKQHRLSADLPEDDDLFNQFSESLEGDARDIVAKLRKRHQGGGSAKEQQAPAKSAILQSELSLKLARRRESVRHKK
ncbi:hypothetical protein DYB32_007548 [Aphanomyces invadans]|uniref:FH2 domain-containing protein n=1 Tax=Aphanomyces invadans TaxID=157072 RepID=A0A3R6VU38_9STRA|nr:hypothetical protein DYB32_007548 [Aphanomyces invadans]